MPNGYHNDASIDWIFHRHTEHGHNHFVTRRHNHGFVCVHLDHHGGYAYEPAWDTLDLYPYVATRRERPTRPQMDELATKLVSGLVAVQASNPKSLVRADRASGIVLLYNWCILLGDYYTYTRASGGSFEQLVPPIGSLTKEDMLNAIQVRPEIEHIARDTHVLDKVGLYFHTPSECVYDFAAIDECIASTAPLHKHPAWADIARLPLDSVESTGLIVTAMREEAVEHGADHGVIRFRNRERMK